MSRSYYELLCRIEKQHVLDNHTVYLWLHPALIPESTLAAASHHRDFLVLMRQLDLQKPLVDQKEWLAWLDVLASEKYVYKGRDVHAYTQESRELAKRFQIPSLPLPDFTSLSFLCFPGPIVQLICEYTPTIDAVIDYLDKKASPGGKLAVQNMRNQLKNGCMIDPDLSCNFAWVVLEVVEKCEFSLVDETLVEIANTCVQGISFRFLSILSPWRII